MRLPRLAAATTTLAVAAAHAAGAFARVRGTACGLALALATLPAVAADIDEPQGESAQAGFVDVDLHIDAMACERWDDCAVSASGSFRGRRVAVDVAIRSVRGSGRITYRSVGPASDALLQALAALYKMPRDDAIFARAADAQIVFLDADAMTMAGKVFFAASGPESDYAELYTDIDKQRRVLEIHEKDPEYRGNVIKALAR